MSFQGKYQILSALGGDETQLFRAVQISSGRAVLIHHLAPANPSSPQPDLGLLIFKFLASGMAEARKDFLDTGEDESRIFIVLADAPDCLDLRQWLKSAIEPQTAKSENSQPAEVTPDAGNLSFTQAFSSEAMRKATPYSSSPSIPPTSDPKDAPPMASAPENGPILTPAPEFAPASFRAPRNAKTDFAGFWERSAMGGFTGQPATFHTPPVVQEGSEGPSEVPEVTAEFLSKRASQSVHDAPTSAMTTLKAQAAGGKGTPGAVAGSAEGKGSSGGVADLVMTPAEVMKPSAAAGVGEVSISPSNPAAPPAPDIMATKVPQLIKDLMEESAKPLPQSAGPAPSQNAGPPVPDFSETRVPQLIKELLAGNDKAVPPTPDFSETRTPVLIKELLSGSVKEMLQAAPPPSQPSAEGSGDTGAKPADAGARPPIPKGFELVFQSAKPRNRTTISGAASQPAIPAAPAIMPPTVIMPVPEKIKENPGAVLPQAPAVKIQDPGARKGPTAPPLPSRPLPESERATRIVPAPSSPPVKPSPPTPAGPAVRSQDLVAGKGPAIAPLPPRAIPESERATRRVAAPSVPPIPPPPAPAASATSPPGAAPPVPVPIPALPNRAREGEYTRMIKNVRAVAGPLPPDVPPGILPAEVRTAANPGVSPPPRYAKMPSLPPSAYRDAPRLQVSTYVAREEPVHPEGRKRKLWVPILILSSLFIMTAGLLLFFALKH